MAALAAFGVMMSQVDKQALREVAVAAKTAGEVPVMSFDLRMGEFSKFANQLTPSTVISLLDENEALEKRVAELAEEIVNLKAKALYWDADNTESSYEDPTDIANDLDLNPGDHFYVQVAYLDKDREYVVNDDWSVSFTQLVDSSAALAQKLREAKA